MNTKRRNPLDRFLEKTERQENGCLFWTGYLTKLGYGRFGIRDPERAVLAYKWWWEQINGPVPEGLELDHLCRNPRCVEPTHLEAVTHKENCLRGESLRAEQARRTHCPRGHSYDDVNTYWYRGKRDCLTCRRGRSSEAWKRFKLQRSMN